MKNLSVTLHLSKHQLDLMTRTLTMIREILSTTKITLICVLLSERLFPLFVPVFERWCLNILVLLLRWSDTNKGSELFKLVFKYFY